MEIDDINMDAAREKLDNSIIWYEKKCAKLEEMRPELATAYERIKVLEV